MAKMYLKNIEKLDGQDFGLSPQDHAALLKAQRDRIVVTLAEEVAPNYYDITLADGRTFEALSGYHLEEDDE